LGRAIPVGRLVGDVTAHEIAPELVGGFHHDEAASRRVDNHVAGVGGSPDKSGDQTDRLDMVNVAIDLLGPPIRDSVVPLGCACFDRRLLQHEQIVAASPTTLAHTEVQVIPRNEIDRLDELARDAEVMPLTQAERIDPAH
jgi:hypothetical protein